MVSLISVSSPHFMISYPRFSFLNAPTFFPIVLIISPPKRHHLLRPKRKQLKQKKQNQFLFEFSDCCGCGVVRMCKRWEGEEGDSVLEVEVLEFMKNSKNPDMFPSRRELIEAGRVDLAEAILKRGGWMSMGWEEDEAEREETEDRLARNGKFSFEKYNQNSCQVEGRSGSELNKGEHLDGNSSPSSSRQSLELAAEDSGIEGILSRLERQRNLSFSLNFGENGSINHVSGDFGDEQSATTSKDGDSCHPERTERASLRNDGRMHRDNCSSISYANVFSSSLKADTWRTWSIQRAGISDAEFEAAEIEFGQDTNGRTVDMGVDPIIADTNDVDEPLNNTRDSNSCVQDITQSDVKTRLQHLKLELSSAMLSLRSNTDDLSNKAKDDEDMRQLSDASEFQENELMNAQDKLRTLRAKLAVLEGKMALAIIDAQKILDEKQKRIDNARRALKLLRTTCIVWPNSGSEVLLAGSYDGWATQGKMERSSTGIFSLCLKLYPGKYEIKFIVDGSWMIDPLRPIVNHNGFENNLLIID